MTHNTTLEFDSTEKVIRTDQGFRIEVKCKRGTGTRDQDEVKAELRTESLPDEEVLNDIHVAVIREMRMLREFDPDNASEEL